MGCPWNEDTCAKATVGGHLHVLQWAHENGCPWNEYVSENAAIKGHAHILQWAKENDCPWDSKSIYRIARLCNRRTVLLW